MKITKLFLRTALAVTLAGVALAGIAEPAGNPTVGRELVYSCAGCHSIPGYKNAYPNYNVPKLGGQHAQYIVAALHAYAKGERQHPTMHAQASTLTDQQIADIAAYIEGGLAKP